MKKIFTTFFLLASLLVKAQDGTIDISFGANGKSFNQSVDGSSRATTFVLPDGKIVQNSNTYNNGPVFAAVRYNADGSIDNTFGTNGTVSTEVSSFSDNSYTITGQPDGKIIIGGESFFSDETFTHTKGSLVLIRYNVDGSLDNSFDGDGIMLLDIEGYAAANAYNIRVLDNGKILVAGFVGDENGIVYHSLLSRFNSDGSLDNTFGENGKIVSLVGSGNNDINNLALQKDGKIVLAGSATIGGHSQFVALRFSSDGVPDNSFGTNGQSIINITNYLTSVSSVAVQPDNKIIIAGNSTFIAGDPDYFTIVRLKEDGTLDNTFNGNGKILLNSSNRGGILNSVLIQQDNKILLGGTLKIYNIITQRTTSDFILLRYSSEGVIDPTLISDYSLGQQGTTGGTGKIFLDEGTTDQYGNIAFQGTKIIVGGTSTYDFQGFDRPRLIVARINNNVGAALPLKLTSFTAKANNENVVLEWQTDQEINTKSFEIERGTNGIKFEKIESVKAAGFSNVVKRYQFTDEQPFTGVNYYRIKMIDQDEKFTHSESRKISFNNLSGKAVQYYPVPTNGLLNVAFNDAFTSQSRSIRIVNAAGVLVKEINLSANQTPLLSIDLSVFSRGIYFIQMKTSNANSTQRIVFQ